MSRTRYKFKGYTITNCGYHQPDHCVWWEAVDENGEACFHGHSLREVEFMILDDEWETKLREKDAEIERLKHSSVGNEAAMREALEAVDKIYDMLSKPCIVIEEVRHACQKARAVLISTPQRNCDMPYYDRVEMYGAFKDWCKAKGHTMEPMLACDAFDWLLAPAAERKGDGDEQK